MTPEVLVHAGVGTLGILSGVAALIARKGSALHRRTGLVFTLALLATSATASYLGWKTSTFGGPFAGVVPFYLVLTGWVTIRRPPGKAGLLELGGFLLLAVTAVAVTYGTYQSLQDGTAFLGGIPGFTLAAVAAIAAGLDLSVVLRRGLHGRQRIARHLWRMHAGFFAAVGSFFPGQLGIFPEFIQQIRPSILLFIPAFSIVGLMIYWLIRVLFTNWYNKKGAASTPTSQQEASPT